MATKYYVVWVGRETGVFDNWPYTQNLVKQFPGAKYKSFKTQAEAEAAFAAGWQASSGGASGSAENRVAPKNAAGRQSEPDLPDNKKFDVVIYCDGGCDPNPGKSASGLSVYREGKLDGLWYGLYNPQGTNNTAELNALHQALLMAREELANNRTVQILCDSRYSINCITVWAFSWKKKGWQRQSPGDIKNLEIIQQAHELYVSIKSDIKVAHVRAHTGIEGNELADRMSIYGIAQKNPEFCQYPEPLDIPSVLAIKSGSAVP